MPYIDQEARDELAAGAAVATPGELTYLLYVASVSPFIDVDGTRYGASCLPPSVLASRYADAVDRYLTATPRYADYAVVLGCLDSCSRELERQKRHDSRAARVALDQFARVFYAARVAPYEDTKIEENGEVVCS